MPHNGPEVVESRRPPDLQVQQGGLDQLQPAQLRVRRNGGQGTRLVMAPQLKEALGGGGVDHLYLQGEKGGGKGIRGRR